MMFGKDLISGNVGTHLVKLTIPMFLGISSMILAAMADVIYVSRISSDQLAALGFCFPVVMLSVSVSMGVSMGATSVIARLVGMGDQAAVKQTATFSLLLSLLLNFAYGGLLYVTRFPLLSLLGAEGIVLEHATFYLSIWLLGFPIFAVVMFLTNILRAVGEAFLPGVVIFASAVIQAAVSPFLIFGWLGLSRLEIEGAAWGFVFSRCVTLVWAFWLVCVRFPMLTFSGLQFNRMRSIWYSVLQVSVPATVTNLIAPISLSIVIVVLAKYGPVVVAAFAVASRIEALSVMLLMALASSVVPFMGQNWAAGEQERSYQSLSISYRFCLIYGVIIAAFLMIFGDSIAGFISTDPEVQKVTYLNLLWVAPTFALLGTVQVSASVFLALGKARAVFIMGVVRIVFIYIPLVWWANHYYGYQGVFAAIGATNILLAVIAYFWSRSFLRHQVRQLPRKSGKML